MNVSESDVVILGSGVAAHSIMYRLREAGRSVAVVETGPPGGTCPTRGCDAKKPYVNAAQRVLQARRLIGHGLAGEVGIDWPALVEFKRRFTEPVPRDTRRDMADAGVELIEGRPRFVDPHTLEINGRRLRGGQIVIATGRRPRTLDLPGAEHAIDSDGFLEMEQLPERLAFVGGGYIAMEFAGVAAVAGARVTVVESGTYPLKPFDRDAVRTVLASLTDLGVRILTQRKVTAIEPGDNGAFVVRTDADTAGDPIVADRVVNASGRVPSIDGLGLEEVGIAFNKQGIEVDASLRSVSHRHVWAAGDVAANGRAPLTPTAAEDGQVVAHNLLHDGGKEQVRTPVSSVAFTLPSIGSVGMSEDEARETFDSIEIVEGDMSQWKHFRQQREPFATYKLVFCDQQKLRGAHLVGADCEEVINLFALAICQKCDKQTLLDATLGYPTVAFSLFQKFRKHRATKAAPQDCGG